MLREPLLWLRSCRLSGICSTASHNLFSSTICSHRFSISGVGSVIYAFISAPRGGTGRASTFSPIAISEARDRLVRFPNLVVEEKDLFDATDSRCCTIFVWDIIEHIENDKRALEKAVSLL